MTLSDCCVARLGRNAFLVKQNLEEVIKTLIRISFDKIHHTLLNSQEINFKGLGVHNT